MTRCAVVLPCRNEAAHITTVLDALAGQSHAPDELVVVDDRSTDDTAEVVRQWRLAHPQPPLRLIEGPGLGPGPAMNVGIRGTDAGIILRIDGHAVPAAGYLAHCLEALADPAVGVVGGIWHVKAGADTAMGRSIAAVVSHPVGSGGARYRQEEAAGPDRVPVETVPFGAFRRAVWERLGGFDESLFANQDFDFNYRVRKAGLQVVLDRRVKSTYFSRPTLGALARQYSRYGYWKVQMLRKDVRALQPRQLPPAAVLPWVVATLAAALLWPGWGSGLAVAVYPALVCVGAVHIAVSRAVNPIAAAVATLTVHLSWSAGFWRGILAR